MQTVWSFPQIRQMRNGRSRWPVCDEQVMEAYLEGEEISREQIRQMIRERKLFPCYFGSALKMTGVEEFLDDPETPDPGDFVSGKRLEQKFIKSPETIRENGLPI